MIPLIEIKEKVRDWSLREDVVEKDYVLGWLLWGIASDDLLGRSWVFKGGTCLTKCYFETYRFSEDLDFTVIPEGPYQAELVLPALERVTAMVHDASGIQFTPGMTKLRVRADGLSAEGRVYYRGPRQTPSPASIKIDLSSSEVIVRPTEQRPIRHPYSDRLPDPGTVQCYRMDELFAEKLRAMGERGRPRDLYDIINLYRREDVRVDPESVRSALVDKCSSKNIPLVTLDSIETSEFRHELETEWGNMLGHQLPALPPFTPFWAELPMLFQWLEVQGNQPALPSIPVDSREVTSNTAPQPTRAESRKASLDLIRFAAINHLCVKLGYGGEYRLIEPYSLYRTADGHLLLRAVRHDPHEPRSYHLTKVQSVEITATPFTPRYAIEFTESGPIRATPTNTNPTPHKGRIYIVECRRCGKPFRRTKRDLTIRSHVDTDGSKCRGTRGTLVDTIDP